MKDLVVKAAMLIRKPTDEVFQAFTDPAITTKFWFTKSSGKVAPGARVRWDWEMYGVHDDVVVHAFEAGKRVVFEWSFPKSNTVEWRFEPRPEGTMMLIENRDLKGDDVVAEALDLTQGWNLVLAAAKAWLEHGVDLKLVTDKSPEHLIEGWRS